MNLSFDPYLFTQIGLDSGSITMLGTIVHRFDEPGEYGGVCYRDNTKIATFRITVDKTIAIAQTNIDLSLLEDNLNNQSCQCKNDKRNQINDHFIVNQQGYILFHVSKGKGGYYVKLKKVDENMDKKIFDSRQLETQDLFSAILLRPGIYSIVNEITNAKGEIEVKYPDRNSQAYPLDPLHINCTKDSFEPNLVTIDSGQGLIYHFKTTSRIKIILTKAIDNNL